MRKHPQQYGTPSPQPPQQSWSPRIPHPQQQQQPPLGPTANQGWISRQLQQQRPTPARGNIIPPSTLPPLGPASAPPPASPEQPPTYQDPKSFGSLTQSFADLSLSFFSPQPAGVPQQQPLQQRDPSPEKGLPSLVAPLPTIASLTDSASSIAASSDPASKVKWAKDVLTLVHRALAGWSSKAEDEASESKIRDPDLARLTDMAIQIIMNIAGNAVAAGPIPRFVAEALYLRAGLYATGSFPDYLQKDLRLAFNDYKTAARAGYNPAWFKIARDYESVGDLIRAKECFDKGMSLNETGCIYRLGMANLLGQLNIPKNPQLALKLLRQAADQADLDTPQPAYVFGMLLLGQFDQIDLPIPLIMSVLPPGSQRNPDFLQSEAKRRIERAAYLAFPPAQYKLGFSYEHAQISCPFDPLLSVQYYSLASQQGELEADMALSKWFLCGSEGVFEKDEVFAVTFAEKAAKKGLPVAEFAMGYYCEVGIGRLKDLNAAKKWYQRAVAHKNPDAAGRLQALSQTHPEALSRAEHDRLTNSTLVRKRNSAKEYSVAHGMGNGARHGTGAEIQEAKRLAELANADSRPREQATISSPCDDISLFITSVSSHAIYINGRFGDVFRGVHTSKGEVALKRLRIGGTGIEEEVIRRFEREADTWRRLKHPHVLEFLGTYKPDGHLYLVSPFAKKGTLLEYVIGRPDTNRIRLLCETSDAVGYLHGENIIHGDIKASNLLISDDGHVLLCDFGLAKPTHAQTSTAVKGAGTLRWQSPELWDNEPRTFASDVYAFSMTIVEVLTGRPPFFHLENEVAVIMAVFQRGERPAKIPMESNGISYENGWKVAEACWPTMPKDRISMSEAFHLLSADASLA